MSSRERRVQCLREIRRVLKMGGRAEVQAWAMEQEGAGGKRRFEKQDVWVPFKVSSERSESHRACGRW